MTYSHTIRHPDTTETTVEVTPVATSDSTSTLYEVQMFTWDHSGVGVSVTIATYPDPDSAEMKARLIVSALL